jgi:hypothetical protein
MGEVRRWHGCCGRPAGLDSGLGSRPRGFESRILRHLEFPRRPRTAVGSGRPAHSRRSSRRDGGLTFNDPSPTLP